MDRLTAELFTLGKILSQKQREEVCPGWLEERSHFCRTCQGKGSIGEEICPSCGGYGSRKDQYRDYLD